MKTFNLVLGLTATFSAHVLAHPTQLQERQVISGQSVYTEPGNQQRMDHIIAMKAQLIAGGATSLDLAIAMHEQGLGFASPARDCDTSQCNGGVPTCIDNYGIFNNNWWQITLACDGLKGLGSCDIAKGDSLFTNYTQMVQCQHQQMELAQFHDPTDNPDSLIKNGTGLTSWFVSQNYGGGGWTLWDGAKRPDSIPWRGDITVNKEYENNVLRIKYWIDNGNHMNDAWLMSSTVTDLTVPINQCIYPGCGTPFVLGH